jgi:Domain of unknown function (DUF4442)
MNNINRTLTLNLTKLIGLKKAYVGWQKIFGVNTAETTNTKNRGFENPSKTVLLKKALSRIISKQIPYTHSIKPVIYTWNTQVCCVCLENHKSVRNHLQSLHALALANVGEFASGLFVTSHIDHNTIFIMTHLETKYYKKAKNSVWSVCSADNNAGVVDTITDWYNLGSGGSLDSKKGGKKSGGKSNENGEIDAKNLEITLVSKLFDSVDTSMLVAETKTTWVLRRE